MQAAATYLNARSMLWLGFFAAVLAAWGVTWAMVSLPSWSWLCLPGDVAAMPFGGVPVLVLMWAAMMAAMMLPTMVPTLSAYARLPGGAGADAAGWAALLGGYLFIWGVASAAFATVQGWLIGIAALSTTGALLSPWASAALLVGAGLWQFSKTKTECQNVCLSPTAYFLGAFRPGINGAFRMGAGLGLHCLGCCAAIMALGFVGGVMSLLWMGAATLFMTLEKLPEIGGPLRRPAGAILILGGLMLAALTLTGG